MSAVDVIESRVLGALRFMDSTTQTMIKRLLRVESDEATLYRNRSSYYVIRTATGLEAHTQSFLSPPSSPPVGSVEVNIDVADPLNRYLPRLATIQLPRDPDPEHFQEDDSLFRAVDIPLYVNSTFSLSSNWSGIRASLTYENGTNGPQPLGGALLRVLRSSDNEVLARGLSDPRGEALVIVPGIPITNFATDDEEEEFDASGPVVISETAVTVEVIVNDTLPWPVDPEVLEANRASWLREGDEPITLTLRTGQIQTIEIEVDLT